MEAEDEGEASEVAPPGDVKLSTVLLSLALVAAIAVVVFAIAVMIGLVT